MSVESMMKNSTPYPTKEQNLAQRDHWLDKAVAYSLDSTKSEKHVEMALDKAHAYERFALNY